MNVIICSLTLQVKSQSYITPQHHLSPFKVQCLACLLYHCNIFHLAPYSSIPSPLFRFVYLGYFVLTSVRVSYLASLPSVSVLLKSPEIIGVVSCITLYQVVLNVQGQRNKQLSAWKIKAEVFITCTQEESRSRVQNTMITENQIHSLLLLYHSW